MMLIELVDSVLSRYFKFLFCVVDVTQGIIVDVQREDGLGTINHKKRGVSRGPARCGPEAPEHRG
jgi:hypothetical protein